LRWHCKEKVNKNIVALPVKEGSVSDGGIAKKDHFFAMPIIKMKFFAPCKGAGREASGAVYGFS
jgi:hypothetical protein